MHHQSVRRPLCLRSDCQISVRPFLFLPDLPDRHGTIHTSKSPAAELSGNLQMSIAVQPSLFRKIIAVFERIVVRLHIMIDTDDTALFRLGKAIHRFLCCIRISCGLLIFRCGFHGMGKLDNRKPAVILHGKRLLYNNRQGGFESFHALHAFSVILLANHIRNCLRLQLFNIAVQLLRKRSDILPCLSHIYRVPLVLRRAAAVPPPHSFLKVACEISVSLNFRISSLYLHTSCKKPGVVIAPVKHC